jgi:hypothetical protein
MKVTGYRYRKSYYFSIHVRQTIKFHGHD